MAHNTISFIVPLFNHLDESRAMLDSLVNSLAHDLDYEVILVDDYSTDGTREWLSTLHDRRIRIVLNPVNLGYAKSNNIGAQLATGKILGLLNNDLVFQSGWLEPMLWTLESSTLNAGLVGNIQERVADGEIDHAGILLNPRAQFVHAQNLPHHLVDPIEFLAVTGACVLLHQSDFDLVGGFNESYLNGCEDIDLCFKLRALGKKIYLAPDSQIEHHVSLSRNRSLLQNQRNSQILFAKWRHEILDSLTRQWIGLLKAGELAYSNYIDGDLSERFLSDISAGALLIAQSMLLREEYQWMRALGQVDPNADLEERHKITGLIPIPTMKAYLAEHEFELSIANARAIRSFFVCGRKINAQVSGPMAITILVDDNQSKTYILPRGDATINLGIVDPILSGGDISRFKVRVDYVDEEGRYLTDAGKTTLITHFVVDGQTIGAIS
jgi:GT2 family glycosyltransferase